MPLISMTVSVLHNNISLAVASINWEKSVYLCVSVKDRERKNLGVTVGLGILSVLLDVDQGQGAYELLYFCLALRKEDLLVKRLN